MNVMSVRRDTAQNQAQDSASSDSDAGDRHDRAVWPFAGLVAAAGLVMLGYALLSEPGWMNGLALTVCGTGPTGPHAVLLSGILMTDASGRRVDWSIVQDISRRKAMETELADAIPLLFWIVLQRSPVAG